MLLLAGPAAYPWYVRPTETTMRNLALPALLAAITANHVQTVTPGTYDFRVCADACSTPGAREIARGVLVLFADSAALSESIRASGLLVENRIFRFSASAESANACFKVHSREGYVGDREFYLGIIPRSVTRWRISNDSASIQMYRSPDAAYHFTWVASGEMRDSIVGIGVQHDCCGPKAGPFGIFIARRRGAPDARHCA